MCSRYWSGDAVLQLAAVHLQSKVPRVPIQLPDELELISILQHHTNFFKVLSTNRVLLGMAMPLFCVLCHGLSSNLLSQKCVCVSAHINTYCAFTKTRLAINLPTTEPSPVCILSCAKRCFLDQNFGIVLQSSASWTHISVCLFLFLNRPWTLLCLCVWLNNQSMLHME